MEPYAQPKEELGRELNTDLKSGLTEEEASARLSREGPNKLAEGKKRSWLVRFLLQFKDVMIIILLVAAAVSFGIAVYEQDAEGLWNTDMFGRTFKEMAQSALHEKLANMPAEARSKLRRAVGRIVNEGKGGVICILL